MRSLNQDRLDVVEKTRSNAFNWRGQFTPQLVDYLLEEFAPEASAVVDPFCGSGTVLLESASRDLAAYGVELNPAAYAMAKFSTLSALSLKQRRAFCREVEAHIDHTAMEFGDLPLWGTASRFREKARSFLDFSRALLDRCETKRQTLLATLVLFEAESVRNGNLLSAVRIGFRKLSEQLLGLPHFTFVPQVFLCDARIAHRIVKAECDFLITSPPYINVFNYHQNHRAIVELLGFDVLSVAKSEIGSNRKNRGNRFKTVVQYALEMGSCLYAFNQLLKDDSYAALVVGRESNVRGIPFRNGEMVARIAQEGELFHLDSSHERSFMNRFGTKIVEDILILKKRTISISTPSNIGRTVAEDALRAGLHVAEADAASDIGAALADIDKISESPLLERTPIL